MSGEISHKGVIKRLSKEEIIVGIISESACTSCHAKGVCTAADIKDKEIEISHYEGEFHEGQQVLVVGKTAQGFRALFYGYLLPFLLLLTVLVISTNMTSNEGLSGLLSLGVLIPYYLVLYLFRNKFKKTFGFEIKPLE